MLPQGPTHGKVHVTDTGVRSSSYQRAPATEEDERGLQARDESPMISTYEVGPICDPMISTTKPLAIERGFNLFEVGPMFRL